MAWLPACAQAPQLCCSWSNTADWTGGRGPGCPGPQGAEGRPLPPWSWGGGGGCLGAVQTPRGALNLEAVATSLMPAQAQPTRCTWLPQIQSWAGGVHANTEERTNQMGSGSWACTRCVRVGVGGPQPGLGSLAADPGHCGELRGLPKHTCTSTHLCASPQMESCVCSLCLAHPHGQASVRAPHRVPMSRPPLPAQCRWPQTCYSDQGPGCWPWVLTRGDPCTCFLTYRIAGSGGN